MRRFRVVTIMAVLLGAALISSCLRDSVAVAKMERRIAFDHLTRGQDHLTHGDFILARDAFLDGVAVSDRPVLQYHVAHVYYRLGHFEHSLPWYDRAVEMAPGYQLARAERELARVNLARRLNEDVPLEPLGEGEAAIPADQQDTEGQPVHTTTASLSSPARAIGVITGSEDIGLSDLPDANMEDLRRAVFPELFEGPEADLPALRAAARDAARAGRMDEASRFWSRVLALDPADLDARLGLADALARTGRTRAATEEYQRAQRLYPRQPRVYYEWGNFLVSQDDMVEARARFQRTIELDPAHERGWNNLGVIHLREGRLAEALAAFEEATRLNDLFTAAWLNKAITKEELGRPSSEVLADLERYMRLRETPDPTTERWIRDLRRSGAN